MKNDKNHANNLTMAGFALFLCGSTLSIVQDSNTFLKILGVVLVIASAALFGAAISMRKNDRV